MNEKRTARREGAHSGGPPMSAKADLILPFMLLFWRLLSDRLPSARYHLSLVNSLMRETLISDPARLVFEMNIHRLKCE
jgi:hypothetical protein